MCDLIAHIDSKREQISAVLLTENYSVEEFSVYWQEFHSLLAELCIQLAQTPELEIILADNLLWVSLVTEKINFERNRVATAILQLRKGKVANQRYGDNN